MDFKKRTKQIVAKATQISDQKENETKILQCVQNDQDLHDDTKSSQKLECRINLSPSSDFQTYLEDPLLSNLELTTTQISNKKENETRILQCVQNGQVLHDASKSSKKLECRINLSPSSDFQTNLDSLSSSELTELFTVAFDPQQSNISNTCSTFIDEFGYDKHLDTTNLNSFHSSVVLSNKTDNLQNINSNFDEDEYCSNHGSNYTEDSEQRPSINQEILHHASCPNALTLPNSDVDKYCSNHGSNYTEDSEQRPSISPEILHHASCPNALTLPNSDVDENLKYKGRQKKGRKRKFEDQDRATRKKRCIQNTDYFTQRNKFKEAKEFRHYICSCKCLEIIGEENARKEFVKFYNVESHDAQRALICSMVLETEIKRKRVKDSNRRKFTRQYKLSGVVVCKNFFLQTLRISSCKVNTALKAQKRQEGVRDCRGIGGGKNKIDQKREQEVIEHIKKFPRYKSHYRRSVTESQFLTEDTTVKKMYELYTQEVAEPVKLAFYKKIFLTRFNLRRKKLKKDTCNVCDRLAEEIKDCVDNTKLENLKKEKYFHLEKAENAQAKRKEDMLKAKDQPDLETLCYDLEKTLPLPRIPTNIVYYKRQLCVYNLGIHSGKNSKGHCYVWIEGEAGRGAQEVGSCLKKHIEDTVTAKQLILWSDSCGGQNRNIKIVLMLKTIMEKHPTIEKIILRYLVPGHSFLPNDSDFGDIECALKLQQRLYSVDDYMNVMKQCRKKNPLVVHRMAKQEFLGTKKLEGLISNRKTDVRKEKISWLNTREIEIRKESPLSIFMKSDFKQINAVEVDIEKKQNRGRPSSQLLHNLGEHLIPLWPAGKPISNSKLEDLKFLLSLIPKDAKSIYKYVIGSEEVEDDIDGFNGELDFEIENE